MKKTTIYMHLYIYNHKLGIFIERSGDCLVEYEILDTKGEVPSPSYKMSGVDETLRKTAMMKIREPSEERSESYLKMFAYMPVVSAMTEVSNSDEIEIEEGRTRRTVKI